MDTHKLHQRSDADGEVVLDDDRTDLGETAAPIVVDRARGGFSFGSVLTGVLVAFGAFIVLSALIGATLVALGFAETGIDPGDARTATIGAGIGLIVAQLLAYLWGGYTAGRMARGAGLLNGLLVAILALVLVALVGAVVAAVSGSVDVQAQTDAAQAQLPLPLSDLAEIGTGVGIGVLLAMLLGGVLGGWMGQRWHTKLENAESDPVHSRETIG
jgi:hypothetical protein